MATHAHLPRFHPHVHAPHVGAPHPLRDLDEHPWRLFPIALAAIALFATILIGTSFLVAKLVTGHAY